MLSNSPLTLKRYPEWKTTTDQPFKNHKLDGIYVGLSEIGYPKTLSTFPELFVDRLDF